MKKYILALGITRDDLDRCVGSVALTAVIVVVISLLGYGVTLIAEPIMGRPMSLEIGAKLVIGIALIVSVFFCFGGWFRQAIPNYRLRLKRYIEREQSK